MTKFGNPYNMGDKQLKLFRRSVIQLYSKYVVFDNYSYKDFEEAVVIVDMEIERRGTV